MTKNEAKKAFEIANDFTIDLTKEDDSNHFGFGLPDFKPVYTTVKAVARTMRWQGCLFNGTWDMNAINEVIHFGRKNFMIIG
jgi:hypothetical protein